MDYINYNRTFIMLEEKEKQFAAKKSAPIKGYLKVETENNKGTICCVTQNLQYFEKGGYLYKLVVFGEKEETIYYTVIGDFPVDKQGNGETIFDFLPLDIDGKGTPYHEFSVAIITAESMDDKVLPCTVLKGYLADCDIDLSKSTFFK